MTANKTGGSVLSAEPAGAVLSWAELLLAYRIGRGERAAAGLLDRLGPWLINARKTLAAASPVLDSDDIAQELVVRILARASQWEPNCEDRWIPRRLVEPVERTVRQTLRAERQRAAVELEQQLPAPNAEEPALLLETPIGRASATDLQLIFRFEVMGERLEWMAGRAGVTPRRMRQRIDAAKRRARA